jgi:hypothetical protein
MAPGEEQSDEVLAAQAYLLLARQIKNLACSVCGLWPVRPPATFQDVAVGLAKSLASLGSTTGIIVRQEDWRDESPDSQPAVRVVSDGVEAITPVRSSAGVSPTLEQTLAAVRDHYACVLLDLSGLDIATVAEVAHLPDMGIILLVTPGTISEFALTRLRSRFSPERLMGAVLVDTKPSQHPSD